MIAEARDEHGADVVLFPELALSGYPPEDLLLRPAFLADCEAALQRIAARRAGHRRRGRLAAGGRRGGLQRRQRAARRRASRTPTASASCPTTRCSTSAAISTSIRTATPACSRSTACRVGLVICEDLWFAEPLAADRGSRRATGAGAERLAVRARQARAARCAAGAARAARPAWRIAYLNVVGGQDALVFDGASVLADGDGTRASGRARRSTDHWLVADFDAGDAPLHAASQWPDDGDESRDALAWRAIVRGTRDYCAQERLRARSGSACPAASIRRWCWRSRSMRWARTTSPRCACRRATPPTCPTTSPTSSARALGVRLLTLPIETPFQGFLDALAPDVRRPAPRHRPRRTCSRAAAARC